MSKEAVEKRVEELDNEWDIDRMLEFNAGIFSLAGAFLAATANRKWLWLSGIVSGFLAFHSVKGWSPPVRLFRWMGIRTRKEIDREKFALLHARGAA